MFYVYDLPVPRFQKGDESFSEIVERSARLICTSTDFDDLAKEIFSKPASKVGMTDPKKRQQLRNELDAIIAKLYGLKDKDLQYVLSKFPNVEDDVKEGVLEEFKKLS